MREINPRSFTLANGLKLVVVENDKFPMVSICLTCPAGSFHDPEGLEGMAHFVEHMHFKGTSTRKAGEIFASAEEVGGQISAKTDKHLATYTLKMPDDKWQQGLELLEDAIFNSVYSPDEIEKEKGVILAEMNDTNEFHVSRLHEMYEKFILAGTPGGRSVIGDKESLERINQEKIKEFVGKVYQPNKMVIAVCGQVKAQEVADYANALFQKHGNSSMTIWPDHRAYKVRPAGRVHAEYRDIKGLYLISSFLFETGDDFDYPSLFVLLELLALDTYSLLHKKMILEENLANNIFPVMTSFCNFWCMGIMSRLKPENLHVFKESLAKVMQSLDASMFTDRQIEAVKKARIDYQKKRLEIGSCLCEIVATNVIASNNPLEHGDFQMTMNLVNRDSIQRVIDAYVKKSTHYAIGIVPEKSGIKADDLLLPIKWEKEAEKSRTIPSARPDRVQEFAPGKKLYTSEAKHKEFTSLFISWKGGVGIEGFSKQGIANITGHLLGTETVSLSADEMQEFFKENNVRMIGSTYRNSFYLVADFHVKDSGNVYDLLNDIICNPVFSEKNLAKEVNSTISMIQSIEEKASTYPRRHFDSQIFSSGIMSLPYLGDGDFLGQLTPEMVYSFWEKQRCAPLCVSAVGKIDYGALENFAQKLGSIKTIDHHMLHEGILSENMEKTVTLKNSNKAQIKMGFPIPGKRKTNGSGIDLLRAAISGPSGSLFKEVRDSKGLSYSLGFGINQLNDLGIMGISVSCDKEKVDDVISSTDDVIRSLQEGLLDEKSMKRAINTYVNRYHDRNEESMVKAAETSDLIVHGYDPAHKANMVREAASGSCTPEDIRELARKYLDLNNRYMMIVTS
ncbi:M16 family metallopeptidase [Desulfonatronovibrio magnus]|uniref:M16 family metallopeptidase n=1 Tax=Desulfonatronovibrio magnus TaxID=698827 RepID=UPI0005EBE2EE|nr:M16 family metallopeptidase [Desulfonatronovibrio magnus]